MLEIVENLWAIGGSPKTPLGSLQRFPDHLAGGEGLPVPFLGTPPRFSAAASIFSTSGLIRQPPPSVFIFPQCMVCAASLLRRTFCMSIETVPTYCRSLLISSAISPNPLSTGMKVYCADVRDRFVFNRKIACHWARSVTLHGRSNVFAVF